MWWTSPGRPNLVWSALMPATCFALLLFTHALWLQVVGNVLLLNDSPSGTDAVVVLAGNTRGGRLLRGARLVRDGYAPRLFVLDDESCVHGICQRWSEAWRSGVARRQDDVERLIPREAIVPLLEDIPLSPGTFEEAEAAWARLQPLGVRRILLVTDEFHSRRATLAWRKVVGSGGEVFSVPCSDRCVSVHEWWRNREGLLAVWVEIPKLAIYLKEGHLL